MKIGITVVQDLDGKHYVLASGKAIPLTDVGAQKMALKLASVKGLRIGKQAFATGMVISQHGIEARKSFAVVTEPPAMA